MTSGRLVLGIDLGTSSLKCGVFDSVGRCARLARVPYPTREGDGGAEQQCVDWWKALVTGVRLATEPVDRRLIVALGVGGHAPSPAFVDSHLQPVFPVLPWFDSRTVAQREELLRRIGRPPQDGSERLAVQIAARAMWLRSAAPTEFARVATILQSGDYLLARLTGESTTSTTPAPAVFAAAGLPDWLWPKTESPTGKLVGPLLSDVAAELGLTPAVWGVSGGLDSFLASVGSGMRVAGDACVSTGSSSVVALLTRSATGRFEWLGSQILSQPISAGGRLLQWTHELAADGDSFEHWLIEAAQMQPLSPLRPSFAETIRLMRRNDGELRTRLAQLARSRMPVEMFRCVLEAIFLWQRTVLGDLEQRTEPARRIRCVGRLAVCPAVNQLQADVLGRVVEVPQFTDSGPLGAAILAMIAVGNCDPVEASTRMTAIGRTYYPRDEVTAVYQSCGVDSS